MNKTEKKVGLIVAIMVATIYITLIYTGNFNLTQFIQGFGEGLASMIVVVGMTYLIVRFRGRRKDSN